MRLLGCGRPIISFALCLCVIKITRLLYFLNIFEIRFCFILQSDRSLKNFNFDSALAGTALGLVKEILCELQYRWRMRRLSGIEIALFGTAEKPLSLLDNAE